MLVSWQPTAAAIATSFFGFVTLHPEYFQSWVNDIAAYFAMGGLVLLGLSAKQHNVTGGNKEGGL